MDEEGVLANSYEFNKLLLLHRVTMRTTRGYSSHINKIIEFPNREYHTKIRITLETEHKVPKSHWCFT